MEHSCALAYESTYIAVQWCHDGKVKVLDNNTIVVHFIYGTEWLQFSLWLIFLFLFLKVVLYSHQSCIYLIKKNYIWI